MRTWFKVFLRFYDTMSPKYKRESIFLVHCLTNNQNHWMTLQNLGFVSTTKSSLGDFWTSHKLFWYLNVSVWYASELNRNKTASARKFCEYLMNYVAVDHFVDYKFFFSWGYMMKHTSSDRLKIKQTIYFRIKSNQTVFTSLCFMNKVHQKPNIVDCKKLTSLITDANELDYLFIYLSTWANRTKKG